ncbi:hypothetical protein ACWDCZ_38945, partial [Kitasatospora sp. NPDC001225]
GLVGGRGGRDLGRGGRWGGTDGRAVDRGDILSVRPAALRRLNHVDAAGVITTVTGAGDPDADPALRWRRSGSGGVAGFTRARRAYRGRAADLRLRALRVRKVDEAGVITTVAGTENKKAGDGTPLDTYIGEPAGIAEGAAGSIYITAYNLAADYLLWKVSPDGGTITRIAGGGSSADDGVPAIEADLDGAAVVAVDASGVVYLTSSFGHRVRRIGADGRITTVAGTGGSTPPRGWPSTVREPCTSATTGTSGCGR